VYLAKKNVSEHEMFPKEDKEENEEQKLHPVQFSVGFSFAGG
jgi:hypothetical protein